MNYTIEEQERIAFASGDTRTADLLARIVELEGVIQSLQNQIDDTITLEDWENKNGPAYDYVQFFHACFERLGAHYPCPSITSDYDKSVIFDAIERGEA